VAGVWERRGQFCSRGDPRDPDTERQTHPPAYSGSRIAIALVHSQRGHKPLTVDETVRVVMKGIRRTIGTARDTKTPATHDILARCWTHAPTR
jgi:hypothetical protein